MVFPGLSAAPLLMSGSPSGPSYADFEAHIVGLANRTVAGSASVSDSSDTFELVLISSVAAAGSMVGSPARSYVTSGVYNRVAQHSIARLAPWQWLIANPSRKMLVRSRRFSLTFSSLSTEWNGYTAPAASNTAPNFFSQFNLAYYWDEVARKAKIWAPSLNAGTEGDYEF